jgi:hypothetical protein
MAIKPLNMHSQGWHEEAQLCLRRKRSFAVENWDSDRESLSIVVIAALTGFNYQVSNVSIGNDCTKFARFTYEEEP